jgi:uncharacterized FlaG/YvyC family protein
MDVQAIDPTRAATPAPATPANGSSQLLAAFPTEAVQKDETLHKALAQLVGSDVSVQFQVVQGTHDIITVFKDKLTGRVITQFPPEAMVLIAQFFNKLAGAVLDRTA